jgi:DNA processing protein
MRPATGPPPGPATRVAVSGDAAAGAAMAHAAALAGLPGMGPARLRALLRAWEPVEAWRRVMAGRAHADRGVAQALGAARERVTARWAHAARAVDPVEVLRAHAAAGVAVHLPGTEGYPDLLDADPEPPVVLFTRGDPSVLDDRPRVAVVGTRSCTAAGASVATELGRDLAAAGVVVVSGLAAGIDGAAHRGALEAGAAGGAPPVGVVGSGLDVVYPARHRALWGEVAAAGALLSEAPLGARPEPWRFPARNRVIAGLSEVVVVVESHTSGGSLHTVDEAADRGVPVMAVPGSVRSPASDGTNQLLHDGCAPVRGVDDILDALPARWSDHPVVRSPAPDVGLDVGSRPVGEGAAVLDALGGEPAALEQLAVRTGLDLGALAVALEQLVAAGRVEQTHGWFERVHR